MSFERTVLEQIIHNEEYARRVVPHLKMKYFEDTASRNVLKTFIKYFTKYNKRPNLKELAQDIIDTRDMSEYDFESTFEVVKSLDDVPVDLEWALDKTESWCQDRAVELAVFDAISIIEGEDKKRTKHAIPDLLQQALAVSFDVDIGHDWLEDAELRHEFYNDTDTKIPTGITILDDATNGGIPRKTLNVIQGGPNIGKTMMMCALSSLYIQRGYNVVYFTMEMAREWIANRVDANLMNLSINDVQGLTEKEYMSRINAFREKSFGTMKIVEYPTGEGNVNLFSNSLTELRAKKNFKPDIIMADYIGIMASVRVEMRAGIYHYRKAIAEELRALAKKEDATVWSGNQVNRDGFASTDPDITASSESFGIPATADFYVSAVRTDELDELGQLMIIQNKSRYGNKSDTKYHKMVVGMAAEKAQMFNVDPAAQRGINTTESDEYEQPRKKSKFEGLEI